MTAKYFDSTLSKQLWSKKKVVFGNGINKIILLVLRNVFYNGDLLQKFDLIWDPWTANWFRIRGFKTFSNFAKFVDKGQTNFYSFTMFFESFAIIPD